MDVLLARLTGEPSRQGSGSEWCKARSSLKKPTKGRREAQRGSEGESLGEVTVRTALRLRNVLAAWWPREPAGFGGRVGRRSRPFPCSQTFSSRRRRHLHR